MCFGLDDIAEQLTQLLQDLKDEKNSFIGMGIDYEEKAFYDILKAVAKKYEFDEEYPDDKMIELSKRIKIIVDDKSKYTDWSTREDIKAELKVNIGVAESSIDGMKIVLKASCFSSIFAYWSKSFPIRLNKLSDIIALPEQNKSLMFLNVLTNDLLCFSARSLIAL